MELATKQGSFRQGKELALANPADARYNVFVLLENTAEHLVAKRNEGVPPGGGREVHSHRQLLPSFPQQVCDDQRTSNRRRLRRFVTKLYKLSGWFGKLYRGSQATLRQGQDAHF